MPELYVEHAPALTTLFADLETFALQNREAFPGTAGSIAERKNAAGVPFYAHRFYDGEGKQRERYLAGPIGSSKADAAAQALRERIAELKQLVPSLRLLAREGFNRVNTRTYATIAVLHNHGVFEAGGILVGTHAYSALLNSLGVRVASYVTEDVDIARPGRLAFESLPEISLLQMLRESGIEFFEVPQLDRRQPSTSFARRGRSHFRVDLLVPSPDETYPVIPVPELQAHAIGLPHLDYLLAESQRAMIVAREGCVGVRVPLPERFAVHKLLVSQLRTGRRIKSEKDVHQACVLSAVLGNRFPGALEEAREKLPKRAMKRFRAGLAAAEPVLSVQAPRAWEELRGE